MRCKAITGIDGHSGENRAYIKCKFSVLLCIIMHIFTWAISFARHYNYKELSKHNMAAFSGADRTSVFYSGCSCGGSDSATTRGPCRILERQSGGGRLSHDFRKLLVAIAAVNMCWLFLPASIQETISSDQIFWELLR
jgi:hypothetical protein